MPHELAIFGVLVPTLLPLFLACIIILWLLDRHAGRHGWYRHVWHPSLFRLAVLACLFSAAGLLFL